MRYLLLCCVNFLSVAAMHSSESLRVKFFLDNPNNLAEKYFNFASIRVDPAELVASFYLVLGVKVKDSSDVAKLAFEQYQLRPVEAFALKVTCNAFERHKIFPSWDFITDTDMNFFAVLGCSDRHRVYELVFEQKERILSLMSQVGRGRRDDEFADMIRVAAHSCNLY